MSRVCLSTVLLPSPDSGDFSFLSLRRRSTSLHSSVHCPSHSYTFGPQGDRCIAEETHLQS